MRSSKQLRRSVSAGKPLEVRTYSDNDYDYVQVTQTERKKTKPMNLRISWLSIVVLIGLVTGRLRLVLPPNAPLTENLPFLLAEADSQPVEFAGERLNETGRVFADIDSKYLGEEDMEPLHRDEQYSYEELLGYAINGVYAQHGLNYKNNAKYQSFFGKFQWYQPDTFDTEEVTDRFNRYEAENIRFLAEKRDQFKE